jgi:hypothetical protein
MRSGFMATALTAALISGLVTLPSLEGAAAEGQEVAQAVDAVGLGLAVEAGTRALKGASDVIEVAADAEEDSENAGDELHDAAVEATGKVEAIKPTTDQAGSAAEAAGAAAAETIEAATAAISRTADAAADSTAAVTNLNEQLKAAKTSLDQMVVDLIEVSGLEHTGLSPNQVYGIAAGAVAGAVVADVLGASGLTSLGVMSAAAALGAYVVKDGGVVEDATEGVSDGMSELAP